MNNTDNNTEQGVIVERRSFSLDERVMQAHIEVSLWTGQRVDREASDEVTQAKNAEKGAAKVIKEVVNSKWLEKIKKIAGAARLRHYARTFPGFASRGPRLLASEGWQDHVTEMNGYKAEFINEVEHLGENWATIREAARRSLGDLWKDEEFPTWENVKGRFSFQIKYYSLPKSNNWILNLDEENLNALRAEASAATTETLARAVNGTYERIIEAVKDMATKLREYDPHGGRGTGFRDTLMKNIVELADMLPGLNFSGDPRVDDIAKELRDNLGLVDGRTLRESDITRNKVADAAEDIMRKVSGWMTPLE